MHIAPYAVGLLLGITNSRVATAMARAGMQPTHIVPAVPGFLAMVSTFGLVILGFLLYDWWVPIVCFVGVSVAAGLVVTRERLFLFHSLNLVFGITAIALCAYGWWVWWAEH